MAINILCATGLHSWSGRVCCKCGKKRGERRLPQVNVGGSKEVYFPVDLYNQGVRLFNAGDKLGAKDVFLNVCNHSSVEPSFRFYVTGGIAVALQSKKEKRGRASQQEDAAIQETIPETRPEAIATFILINLVRSLDQTIEAMEIRMITDQSKIETDFRFRGRNYGCSVIFANGEYCGAVWSFEKGVREVLAESKKHFPRCHGDEVVKKAHSDWLALKPKLPLLPINFVLSLDGYAI